MTAMDVIEAWQVFPKLGRVSFLLTSQYMKVAYPEDNEDFISALDRLALSDLTGLPGVLQNEFRTFMDTPRYQAWLKKGGG